MTLRYIDLDEIKPDIRHLLAGLDEAHMKVMQESDPRRRAAVIERYQQRWRGLRSYFESYSSGKCWYTECRLVGASNDIDHFRPKLGVREDRDHPGYYWLAFDWRNMRLSCQSSNRPQRTTKRGRAHGKAGHFPLLDPAARARGPADDISRERPALLDPTNPFDVTLLSFKQNGEVDLTPEYKGVNFAESKFEASRLHLHLNSAKLRDARVMLYNTIERTVDRGSRAAPANFDGSEPRSPDFLNAITDLARIMDRKAEYSAAARVYVESFKSIWWVNEIVLKIAV